MNIKKIVCITALASLAMTGTAFAGTWKGGEGENQNKWWYDNGNGSYPQTAGSGSMEMGMGQRKVIISIIMAGC